MTPAEKSLAARVAAYTLHSRVDGAEHTAPARQAFLDRFAREVDPDNKLDPIERHRRAEAARKAYFSRLALQSARARRQRRASDAAGIGGHRGT